MTIYIMLIIVENIAETIHHTRSLVRKKGEDVIGTAHDIYIPLDNSISLPSISPLSKSPSITPPTRQLQLTQYIPNYTTNNDIQRVTPTKFDIPNQNDLIQIPDYTTWSENQMKEELKKYAIKPGGKVLTNILLYIYIYIYYRNI